MIDFWKFNVGENLIKEITKILNNSIKAAVENNMPIDMIELDIKNIWEQLGTINGTTYEEELLDEMFSRFYKGNGREFKPYSANDDIK